MAQQRKGPFGSQNGGHEIFDDALFDRVQCVTIGVHETRKTIVYISLKYERTGDPKPHVINHGEEPRAVIEVGPFNQHHGFIKTVGGTYTPGTTQIPTGYISSLYFVNSLGSKSEDFGASTGDVNEKSFTMTGNGGTQLVGLYGRFGHELISIGAIFEAENPN